MTSEEIMKCASEAFSFMRAQTKRPSEVAEILCAVHLILWINCKDESATVDQMLEDYANNFKRNYRNNLDA